MELNYLPAYETKCPVGDIYERLLVYVSLRRERNSHEYGFAQVFWPQLSIVFCRIRERPIMQESLLYFGGGVPGTPDGLFIPEQFPLREHLLFVTYAADIEMLYVLGDLSLRKYQSFLDAGYIAVGELNIELGLLYDAYPPEEQFVQDARQFVNFYQPLFSDPEQAFSEVPSHKRLASMQGIFDLVVYGMPLAHPRRSLYETIMLRLLCEKRRPLSFYYGCLLSSLNKNFHTAYVKHEQARLHSLLGLFFTNESKRRAFVHNWFYPAVQVVEPAHPNQFFNPPVGLQLPSDKSELAQLQARHAARYPNLPMPGLYFRVEASAAPSLLSDMTLPNTAGRISFTHYELDSLIDPMVARAVQCQVDYFRRECEHHMLERYVIAMLEEYMHGSKPVHMVENGLRRLNPKLEEAELSPILNRFRSLLPGILQGKQPVLGWASKFIGGIEGIWNQDLRVQAWPVTRLNYEQAIGPFYEMHPELKSLHEEAVPADYQALLEYAERLWPPCMQRLAAGRTGDKHLRHVERVAVAAQLRRFGYTEKQGLEYWRLLFSETDVYKDTGEHNFLDSAHGQVIVLDYRRDKQVNIGVSCQNWIDRGFCPMVDIEDTAGKTCECKEKNGPQFKCKCREVGCRTACRAKYSVQNEGRKLRFEVESPRHYFMLARADRGLHTIPEAPIPILDP